MKTTVKNVTSILDTLLHTKLSGTKIDLVKEDHSSYNIITGTMSLSFYHINEVLKFIDNSKFTQSERDVIIKEVVCHEICLSKYLPYIGEDRLDFDDQTIEDLFDGHWELFEYNVPKTSDKEEDLFLYQLPPVSIMEDERCEERMSGVFPSGSFDELKYSLLGLKPGMKIDTGKIKDRLTRLYCLVRLHQGDSDLLKRTMKLIDENKMRFDSNLRFDIYVLDDDINDNYKTYILEILNLYDSI